MHRSALQDVNVCQHINDLLMFLEHTLVLHNTAWIESRYHDHLMLITDILGIHKGTKDVEGTRHRAFPIGHHRLTRRSRRDFIGAYTQLHTSLGVFSEPCACVPGHSVIFSDGHWVVQSPPQHIISVPLPFSEGDWIPRVCGKVDFSWQTLWRNSTTNLTPCESQD